MRKNYALFQIVKIYAFYGNVDNSPENVDNFMENSIQPEGKCAKITHFVSKFTHFSAATCANSTTSRT